jgi:hypothetical protein
LAIRWAERQASRHIRACSTTSWVMASCHRFGRVRRPAHRDARVATGAWRSALMDACSASNLRPLGWTILRYVTHSNGCAPSVMQSQLIGLKCLMGVRSAETLSRSHDVRRQGPLSVGERSGQLRPYVRPVARRVPLAIMGVRVRVRHQSVWRARGTRLLTVLPDFDCKVFPITLFERFLPDQSGLRPPPTNLRQDVTPQRPLRPRHDPSRGRPLCASSTPMRCAPSCSPVPRLPA